MDLGADRDGDRDDSGHDENGTGQSGHAGAEAYQRRGRRSAARLRPGHDDTEPGYTLPLRIPQHAVLPLRLPQCGRLP